MFLFNVISVEWSQPMLIYITYLQRQIEYLRVVKVVANDSQGLVTRSKFVSASEEKLRSVFFTKLTMTLLYMLLLMFGFI